MRTELSQFEIAVALGLVPGHRIFTKFCDNPAIGAVEEDIWDAGGVLDYLSAAETMSIVSTDVDDTAAGAGAQKVVIIGLDNNFVEIGEEIALNGTTPVVTTLSYRRVIRMFIEANSGKAQGIITATASTATTIQAQMINGNNQTLMSHFTVPAGHTMILTHVNGATGTGKELKFKGRIRDATAANPTDRIFRSTILVESSFSLPDIGALTEKMDFRVSGIAAAAATEATFIYRALLIENAFVGNQVLNPPQFKVA